MRLEHLPKRPLKVSEVDAIAKAGEYDLARPGAVQFGSGSNDVTDSFVIVADDWFGAFALESDGWVQVHRDDRQPDEEAELLYMVAMEQLGLA